MTLTQESCCAWKEKGLGLSRKSLLAAGHAYFFLLLEKTGRLAASPENVPVMGSSGNLLHATQEFIDHSLANVNVAVAQSCDKRYIADIIGYKTGTVLAKPNVRRNS